MNTQSSPEKKMSPSSLSPIRIYVLWHPGFDNPAECEGRAMEPLNEKEKARLDRGLKLARRIFYWFRMENMEGIPVYFRSHRRNKRHCPASDSLQSACAITSSPRGRQYGFQSGMAAMSPTLPSKMMTFKPAGGSHSCEQNTGSSSSDGTVAYNMPECMRKLNSFAMFRLGMRSWMTWCF
jgi:hypothetical protein